MGSKSIRVAPDERFACQSCGRCCTMWSVTVDRDRAERLRRHDWSHIGGGDPFVRNRGPGDEYRIRMVNGRCFFLNDDNRCRIHIELRYEDKPETCKAFPLHLTRVGDATHARLSFYCPAVSANEGKELRNQNKWLQATRKGAGDVSRPGPLKLNDDMEIGLGEAERIEARLLAWVEDREQTMADRIAACADLVRTLSARSRKKGKRAIGEVLDEAGRDGLAAFAEVGREGGAASRAGPVLSLFLGQDTGSQSKPARLGHFFGVRAANLGLCRLKSGAIGAKASWRRIRKVRFDPPTPNDELLTRYFVSKLRGKRYLAGEATLVTGFNLLVVAYGVINVLARLRAASEGREACNEEDVEAAVQAADLLVVEHTSILHGALFAKVVDTLLTPTGLCSSMLARLGV